MGFPFRRETDAGKAQRPSENRHTAWLRRVFRRPARQVRQGGLLYVVYLNGSDRLILFLQQRGVMADFAVQMRLVFRQLALFFGQRLPVRF